MDSIRFDTLTRLFGQGITRRSVTTTLAALTATGLLGPDVATAKKKRRKKKKKQRQSNPTPAPVCDDLRKACPDEPDECCGGLVCDTSNKEECGLSGNRCLRDLNDSCEVDCDCLGFLSCSERFQNTCQTCSDLRAGCPIGDEDCCLSQSFCGNNGCNNDNDGNVCVFLNPGTACTESCQCAAELGCDERNGFECGFCLREASAVLSPAFQEECSQNEDCCRSDYICGVGPGCEDAPMTVCCGPPQATCASDCDCCGALSNCPRAIALESNACGIAGVCCQFAGGTCTDLCDCCSGLECSQEGRCTSAD